MDPSRAHQPYKEPACSSENPNGRVYRAQRVGAGRRWHECVLEGLHVTRRKRGDGGNADCRAVSPKVFKRPGPALALGRRVPERAEVAYIRVEVDDELFGGAGPRRAGQRSRVGVRRSSRRQAWATSCKKVQHLVVAREFAKRSQRAALGQLPNVDGNAREVCCDPPRFKRSESGRRRRATHAQSPGSREPEVVHDGLDQVRRLHPRGHE